MNMYMYMYMYMYVCICICICMYAYVYIRIPVKKFKKKFIQKVLNFTKRILAYKLYSLIYIHTTYISTYGTPVYNIIN